MHQRGSFSLISRFVIGSVIFSLPVAAVCCGGGDDATSPQDGGSGGGKDGTISSDGSSGSDSSGNDGASDDAGSDATVCTSTPCVVEIAAGGDQTCARIDDGTVRCWGQNFYGQIGVGNLSDGGFDGSVVVSPIQVPGVTGAKQILTTDWGRYHGVGLSGFSCVRNATDGVTCWGSNESNELGRGDASPGEANPAPAPVVALTGVASIASDSRAICALLASGAISCWGYDFEGELGPGQVEGDTYSFPGTFMLEAGAATQIAVGRYHSCALLASGQVECWGENDYSELGDVDANAPEGPEPVMVPGVTNVVELKSSGFTTCGRTTTGDVTCWGRTNVGQLGRDAGVGVESDGPGLVDLPAGKKASLIGVGTNHACARLDDDTLWCWGRNFGQGAGSYPTGSTGGQIGPLPDGGSTSSPQKITGLSGRVLQVVGGYAHTCALIEGGSVQCWGTNYAGQLGNGAADDLAHPTPATVTF